MAPDNFAALLERLIAGEDLSEQEAAGAMRSILGGALPPVQIAGFLTALRAKGESISEIAGCARGMRAAMTRVAFSAPAVVDTCGTGGDGKGTFNISTAAAFVVAGAGLPVAKHGNRSISSACGSADVLQAAGVKVDMDPAAAERCLREAGITFLFAPFYHPAMKNVAAVRKELGFRTIFNILGPLANPADANAQVIGVPRKELVPAIAEVLAALNRGRRFSGLIVHEAGYDEMILSGACLCAEVARGKVRTFQLTPKDLGLKKSNPKILRGGNAEENGRILRAVLAGGHPLEDIVVANAALAIARADALMGGGTRGAYRSAALRAREAIAGGAARQKLDALAEWSHRP